LIHVISPCPLGWRFKTEQTIQLAKLAVQSHYFPLYEVERGRYKLNMNPHQYPLDDFLKMQGRFSHLFLPENAQELKTLKDQVDQHWSRIQELCQGKQPGW